MTEQADPTLTREIAGAGVGLARVVRFDPRWPDGFDLSTDGFLRSFIGPLIALPFAVAAAAMLARGDAGQPVGASVLWAAGVGHVINSIGFPAVVFVLARPLRLTEGFAAFVIVLNWAALFLNLALAVASVVALLGPVGFGLFNFVLFLVSLLSIFVTWRAARETLSHEIAPALLMVVLSVGVGALSEQIGILLIKASG